MILEFDTSKEELVNAISRRVRKTFKASAIYRWGFAVGPLIGILFTFYPPMICCLAPSMQTFPNDKYSKTAYTIWSIVFWIWRFLFYGSICTLLWSLYWKRERNYTGNWWQPMWMKDIIARRVFEGKRIVEINTDGFSCKTPNEQRRISWHAIKDIDSDESFIYILPYNIPWYYIPKRIFTDLKQFDNFCNLLMTLWKTEPLKQSMDRASLDQQ